MFSLLLFGWTREKWRVLFSLVQLLKPCQCKYQSPNGPILLQVGIYIRKLNSIPAFTANLTMESFNKRTFSWGVAIIGVAVIYFKYIGKAHIGMLFWLDRKGESILGKSFLSFMKCRSAWSHRMSCGHPMCIWSYYSRLVWVYLILFFLCILFCIHVCIIRWRWCLISWVWDEWHWKTECIYSWILPGAVVKYLVRCSKEQSREFATQDPPSPHCFSVSLVAVRFGVRLEENNPETNEMERVFDDSESSNCFQICVVGNSYSVHQWNPR